jgi:hypothetical protein
VRPERPDIAAPALPGRPRWLGVDEPPKMEELTATGPVLVHFFDFAQLNSVRALPYVIGWDARFRAAGLTTLGVHSPRFPFTSGRTTLGPALARLGVSHPVADDSRFDIWHDYGCEGWPSLFLWNQGGALSWFHFGEGEYAATEAAIVESLDAPGSGFAVPEPLEPIRATDAPGALVAPPSEEVFPGGAADRPWRPLAGGGPLELHYEAGGAHASIDGTGALRVSIDGRAPHQTEVRAPGLADLAVHPRHERHTLRLDADQGIEVYSVSFSAGMP